MKMKKIQQKDTVKDTSFKKDLSGRETTKLQTHKEQEDK